jgi:NADP-dependent 3-hydroxy acid dehydrogenase YdfG
METKTARVVVVTGAGSGIGRATAEGLAEALGLDAARGGSGG